MGQVGKFLRKIGASDGYSGQGYAHYCPACEKMHGFAVEAPFANGARWTFDGNLEAPTFSPSMNIRVGPFPNGRTEVCHYFLKAGRIEYLSDCTHSMRGQTIPLLELPGRFRD